MPNGRALTGGRDKPPGAAMQEPERTSARVYFSLSNLV